MSQLGGFEFVELMELLWRRSQAIAKDVWRFAKDDLQPYAWEGTTEDGTTEKVINGKFDIFMGGVNSWIFGVPFGLGSRNASIFGSDRRLVVDGLTLFGKEKSDVDKLGVSKWSNISGVLLGLGGAIDVIVTNKILLNYYGQNITVERKSHPEFIFKQKLEEASFCQRLLREKLLRFGCMVLAFSVMAARILYLNKFKKDSLAIYILKLGQTLEPRWLFFVMKYEKGCGVADKLEKETAAANARLAVDQEKLLALTNAALGAAPLLVAQGGLATRVLGTHTKNLLGLGAGVAQEVENVVGVVGEHAEILA